MHDPAEIRRYLELRLLSCQKLPALHTHQIPAYQQALADLDRTGEVGDMFGVARAEALDRYHNLVRIHRTFGADVLLRNAFVNLNAAKASTSYAEMGEQMGATAEQTAAADASFGAAVSSVRSLLEALLEWKLKMDANGDGELHMVRHYANLIRQGDPDFTWQKLMGYGPYRSQIPFDDARLAEIGRWFEQAEV